MTDFATRLLSGYETDDAGCWVWQRYLDSDGYGAIRRDGPKVRVHRASYEFHVGPIPAGLVIDHLCRNRGCINPDHMEPVTDEENRMRGESTSTRAILTGRCASGHEFNTENTYRRDGGSRACRMCARLRMRAAGRVQRGLTFTCPVCGEERHQNGKTRHMATHEGAAA